MAEKVMKTKILNSKSFSQFFEKGSGFKEITKIIKKSLAATGMNGLTLPMLSHFFPKHKDANTYKKQLNPEMLVFIG